MKKRPGKGIAVLSSAASVGGRRKITAKQVATVLTAKGRIAAAIYRIKSRILTARLIFPILADPIPDRDFPVTAARA